MHFVDAINVISIKLEIEVFNYDYGPLTIGRERMIRRRERERQGQKESRNYWRRASADRSVRSCTRDRNIGCVSDECTWIQRTWSFLGARKNHAACYDAQLGKAESWWSTPPKYRTPKNLKDIYFLNADPRKRMTEATQSVTGEDNADRFTN